MNNEKTKPNTTADAASDMGTSAEPLQGDNTLHATSVPTSADTNTPTVIATAPSDDTSDDTSAPTDGTNIPSVADNSTAEKSAKRRNDKLNRADIDMANATNKVERKREKRMQRQARSNQNRADIDTIKAERKHNRLLQRQARLEQNRADINTAKATNKAERKREKRMQRQARSNQKCKKDEQLPQEIRLQRKLEAIANLQQNNKRWYRLDNAALMYPLVARGESISIFRVSALLKEPVNPIELQYAVNDIAPRFPTLCGSVKNGLFWPYIERPTIPIIAKPQSKVPGRPMKVDGKHSQVRVNYFGNEVSVEFFHSATDGTGGIIFLNSLLRRYFQRIGKTVDDQTNCFDYRDVPSLEEIRDNFANVAVRKNPPPCPKAVKVSKINGTPHKNKKYITVRGVCSATQLKEAAHRHNATVTQFLGALQLLALDRLSTVTNSTQKKPIRVMIPVNLRKIFNVETIRNFSSYIFYQYNGQTDIDEIIADIRNQEKEQLNENYFKGMVSFNYNNGNLPILKIAPLSLKRAVMSAIVSNQGDGKVNNSTFSNLGQIKAPKEFADLVVRYDFMLGKPAKNTNNFTASTFNDVCVIAVTNPFLEKDCERLFFRELAKAGVDIAVESDIWEDAE